MLKKAHLPWSANQIAKKCNNGTLTFDNVIQRGLVWDDARKSLLIHSIIQGYPIPPFYVIKNGEDYDCLDGQQRANAIKQFLNDDLELNDIPEVEVENDNGEIELKDINGFVFSELDKELQERIKETPLTIYYFEDITDEEIAEMFFRLNNGKPLSAIELTRVKAKSMNDIVELGSHQLFKDALTEKALSRYTNEDIVIKSYAMLNCDEPSLETKVIRPYMESVELTEEDKNQLVSIFDKILDIHSVLLEQDEKKVAKKCITRTHMISLVPIIWDSIERGITVDNMAKWLISFFAGPNNSSVNQHYNIACKSGSAKKENVMIRSEALIDSYSEYFMKN